MKHAHPHVLGKVLGLGLVAWACAGTSSTTESAATTETADPRYVPDLEVTYPPYQEVHVDWKQRLAEAYVYVEHVGSYTGTGRKLPEVFAALTAAGHEPSGPPFGLYYDDPGQVPVERLRSRACFPVEAPVTVPGLVSDVLPDSTVVYAVVAGPYPEIPRAYPGLFAFMQRMGWVENGPIREIYLTPPETVRSYDELLSEIQVPVANAQ